MCRVSYTRLFTVRIAPCPNHRADVCASGCVVCGAQVIADYHTPPGKSLQRDLMATINAAVDFLVRWVQVHHVTRSCDTIVPSTRLVS
jgi:hypothetical protein